MPSFGQKLKTEREKRAITLEQISSSTKIGIRMLQALEDENFDRLPGGIFNKGFVRAYARHVGLDEDQAVADYLEASGQNTPAQPAAVPIAETARPEPPQDSSAVQIPWGLLAAALLLITLGIWLWTRWQHKTGLSVSPPPAVNQTAATPSSLPPAKPGNSAAAPVSNGGASPITVPLKTPAAVPSPSVTSGPITVVILAREDSWLSVAADGTTVFEDILIAENQKAVHAQHQVVLKAGNTGALDFVFNGRKLPSQGDYGEVKTLTFGVSGLQNSASKPSPAP